MIPSAACSVSDMDALQLCGAGLAAAILAVTVGQMRGEWRLLCSLAGGVLLLAAIMTKAATGIGYFAGLLENTPLSEYGTVLLKTLGIGMAVQTTADICRDSGEGALAGKVELIGKIEILLLTLPLVEGILRLTGEILKL